MESRLFPNLVGGLRPVIMSKSCLIRLVKLGEPHLENTRKWLTQRGLRLQIDSLGKTDPKTNRAYWQKKWNDKREASFAILSETGEHVGNCGLSHVDRQRKKAELWIYLGKRLGSGYGRAAVSQLLKFGFQKQKLNRIYVRVLANNLGAQSFFRALNFKEEGRWRQDTCHHGEYIDS